MSSLLIVNPIAGRRRPEAAPEKLLAALRNDDSLVDMVCTTRRGDAEAAARSAGERDYARVIVAGGDGTVNEAATGLMGSGIPLGIVPCGTANVLAYELGIPGDVEQACALALRGTPRSVDVGIANGRAFAMVAGIGFDAELISGISLSLKRRIGKGAYWLAGMRHLTRARPAAYRLVVDGEPREETLYGILVCNTAHYAGRYVLSPDTRPDDGLLDMFSIHARGFAGLLRTLFAFAFNRLPTCSHIMHAQIRSLECETAPIAPYELDGDPVGVTPLSVRVMPGALRIIRR
jgi:diacylglycerol kinase (ATP)